MIPCPEEMSALLLQKEAKLGAEENTFFYDEERKMWRERGAEIPAAAAPLPPPPSARPPSTSVPSAGATARAESCVHSTLHIRPEIFNLWLRLGAACCRIVSVPA